MRVNAVKTRTRTIGVAALLSLAATACVNVKQDPPFTAAEFTVADFNPTLSKVPFPITLTCSAVNPANGACTASGTFDPVRGRVALPITPCQSGQTPCLSAGNPAGCVACDSSTSQALKAGLNTLDGFSTYGEMRTTFNKAISEASLTKQTAFLLDSTTGQLADYSPILRTVDGAPTVLFQPEIPATGAITAAKRPLKPETTYFGVVTAGVRDATGKPIEADRTFSFIRSKSPLANPDGTAIQGSILGNARPEDFGCQGTDAQKNACANATRATLERLRVGYDQIFTALEAAPTPIKRESIAVLWPVRTQSTAKTYLGLRQALAAIAPTFTQPPQAVIPGSVIYASLPAGVSLAVDKVQLGCMRTPTLLDPTTGAFGVTAQGLPAFRPHYVPYVLSLPTSTRPAAGYPIAIFGHEIGRWRYDMLAIANTLATAGIATIAIDHVWHGDRTLHKLGMENDNPALCAPSSPASAPPVKCVDATGAVTTGTPISATACKKCSDAAGVFNPATGMCSAGTPVDDTGVPVPSGAKMFNAANLFATRDNFRQATLDMMQVVRAVKTATTATGGPAFDSSKISFVGQGLGAIFGTAFVAAEPDVKVAVLNAAGGGLANIIEDTDTVALCKPVFDALSFIGVCKRLAPTGTVPATCNADTECNVAPNAGNLCQANKCVQACGCEESGAYLQFVATLQWVLDPADAVNYARMLIDNPLYCQGPSGPVPCSAAPTATPIKKRILLQRIENDEVIPNYTSNALRAAAGLNACYREFSRPAGSGHGFLAAPTDPNVSAAQRQVLSFLASGGATTKIPQLGGTSADDCPTP
jgi:dienelactone hydrolase